MTTLFDPALIVMRFALATVTPERVTRSPSIGGRGPTVIGRYCLEISVSGPELPALPSM